MYNVYLIFRFGLVNAINSFLRLKIRVVCVGNLTLKCLLIEFVIPNSESDFFMYKKSFNRTFQTGFLVQNHHFEFCSQKAGVKYSY